MPPECVRRAGEGVRAVDEDGEARQRQGYDEGGPDRQGEPARRTRRPGHDVADRPRQRGQQAEGERQQRHVAAASEADHHQAGRAERDARDLRRRRPLPQRHRGEQDRQHHLGLQHQAGEPGRHPGSHRGVEERELPQ
ncbi:hypothetical protein GCM10022242_06160 [Nocardioides panacisoli]|uniref:Uncharacterized protein n=1 Tax=Nocardioides panacisoli TaxID=627624 RepID=A0ABP7HW61_9ACTN